MTIRGFWAHIKKLVKTDKFFTGWGVNENSIKVIAEMDKKTKIYQLTLAYLEGINQCLEKGKTPIEFQLLGLKMKNLLLNI